MPSIFSRIVQGEIPCYEIASTENFMAFLDIHPLQKGHTLVIPKKEVDYIFDLEEELFIGLHVFSRYIALALQRAIPCQRIGIAVLGLEVPHTHIHLVPINRIEDLNFSNPRLSLSQEEFVDIASKIKAELKKQL
ncbi:MAG: HIT family protein [Bacteroidia bacterium]|nr:HIT family protein [Bacteroidia bacterium]MDW8157574.1 HIT family protein [Bacteroidia bacterium]